MQRPCGSVFEMCMELRVVCARWQKECTEGEAGLGDPHTHREFLSPGQIGQCLSSQCFLDFYLWHWSRKRMAASIPFSVNLRSAHPTPARVFGGVIPSKPILQMKLLTRGSLRYSSDSLPFPLAYFLNCPGSQEADFIWAMRIHLTDACEVQCISSFQQ